MTKEEFEKLDYTKKLDYWDSNLIVPFINNIGKNNWREHWIQFKSNIDINNASSPVVNIYPDLFNQDEINQFFNWYRKHVEEIDPTRYDFETIKTDYTNRLNKSINIKEFLETELEKLREKKKREFERIIVANREFANQITIPERQDPTPFKVGYESEVLGTEIKFLSSYFDFRSLGQLIDGKNTALLITFLDKKLTEVNTGLILNETLENESEQKDGNKNKEDRGTLSDNPHPRIFTSPFAYSVFKEWLNEYKDEKNKLANFSFLFNTMKNNTEKMIFERVPNVEIIGLLSKYDVHIDRIKTNVGDKHKSRLFNRIKASLKPKLPE